MLWFGSYKLLRLYLMTKNFNIFVLQGCLSTEAGTGILRLLGGRMNTSESIVTNVIFIVKVYM